MTDLADYLSESVREERIRQVRNKINELGVDYIYCQYISITGRIMGKAVPASHWAPGSPLPAGNPRSARRYQGFWTSETPSASEAEAPQSAS